jgi:hypothetical protein
MPLRLSQVAADVHRLESVYTDVLPGHGEPWSHGVKSAVQIARRPAGDSYVG